MLVSTELGLYTLCAAAPGPFPQCCTFPLCPSFHLQPCVPQKYLYGILVPAWGAESGQHPVFIIPLLQPKFLSPAKGFSSA